MEDRHSGFFDTTFKRHWISYPERLGMRKVLRLAGRSATMQRASGAGARTGTSERRNTERALA